MLLKKGLAALLSLCCILPFFTAAASAEDAGTPLTIEQLKMLCDPNYGDINGGGIGIIDARLALRMAADIDEPTAEQLKVGDIDGSGDIDAGDARAILRRAAGLSDFSKEIILQYFRASANAVKTVKPGLNGTITTVSPSILVTIPSADIKTQEMSELAAYMDEQIATYEKYKKTMLAMGLISKEKAAEIDKAIAQWKTQRDNIKKAYEPQVASIKSEPEANHNYSFPVRGQVWSSKAKAADVLKAQMTETNGVYTVTLNYGTFVYNTLPDIMTNLPYGRMFNLPSKTYLTSQRTFNSLTLKDGAVVYTIDAATGAVLSASYAYTYIWDFTLTSTDATTGKPVNAQYVYTVNNTAQYTITPPEQPV